MQPKRTIALIGVFAFFLLLFNAPFLNLPQGSFNGIPALMIYIAILWIFLMIVIARISRSKKQR